MSLIKSIEYKAVGYVRGIPFFPENSLATASSNEIYAESLHELIEKINIGLIGNTLSKDFAFKKLVSCKMNVEIKESIEYENNRYSRIIECEPIMLSIE